jgi:glycosyltransferase involved in cell wall biosynthesis
MAKIYSSFDVLMNCSAGEGFGIPIVEAQACGVPVVTHAVTAMPELTWNGYTVNSEASALASHYGWQFMPSVDDMVYRLECVYRMLGKKEREYGRAMVELNCSVPVITAMWDELLHMVGDLQEKQHDGAKRVLS